METTTTLPTAGADSCPMCGKISIGAYHTPEEEEQDKLCPNLQLRCTGERPKHLDHFQAFRESANKALQGAYPKEAQAAM